MRITDYYEQKDWTHCDGHSYGTYLTLSFAQSACDSDSNCVAVYDKWCTKERAFSLCPKSANLVTQHWSTQDANCVYMKKGGLTFYSSINIEFIFRCL